MDAQMELKVGDCERAPFQAYVDMSSAQSRNVEDIEASTSRKSSSTAASLVEGGSASAKAGDVPLARSTRAKDGRVAEEPAYQTVSAEKTSGIREDKSPGPAKAGGNETLFF